MKLCLISFAYMERGFLPGLIALSRQPGVELTLITPTEYKLGLQTASGVFDSDSVNFRVCKVPIRFAGRQGTFLYHSKELKSALKECQPDIIFHEQEVFALSAGQVAQVAAKLHIPVVLFVYELLYRQLALPRQWLLRYVLKHSAGLVAASSKGVKVHQDWGLRAPATVLPQVGTAFNPTAPLGRRGSSGQELRVCFAGRMVEEKGVDVLIRAVAKLLQRGISVQCGLLGRGPELERLTALAASLGVEQNVAFLPPRDAAGVATLLRENDVLVLASRRRKIWEEQFGRILIEAMAQATIAVGTDTGAIPEVLGSNELVFPEDDVDALAALLERLATDDLFFAAQQERQWHRVRDLYTPEIVAEHKIAFFRECLAQYKANREKSPGYTR